ncbi:PLD nuclease N-terminal domain-containing protein [Propionibacterium sp. oral taxon 192]|uniref:PLD nuclease N-terminal domain-containing protein n=1 Tax=Propionibacterium sp. oral taxon 192 TaxID=671222 RepID=UPI0005624ACE|nr:PLD nuclease N-terminal domain-containing protein [Propionibacterium sp. oral taxon 192]
MARFIPVIVLIALTIYCTIEVAQSGQLDVRVMPRWLWAVVVITLPGLGPLAWLIFGRPRPGASGPTQPRAPDDDPDFLRGL